MSGESANKGFYVQTAVALLEALKDKSWIQLKIEDPNNEKVDIALMYQGQKKAIQVKHSINPFSYKDIVKWINDLVENARDYDSIELCLVGEMSGKTSRVISEYISNINDRNSNFIFLPLKNYKLNELTSNIALIEELNKFLIENGLRPPTYNKLSEFVSTKLSYFWNTSFMGEYIKRQKFEEQIKKAFYEAKSFEILEIKAKKRVIDNLKEYSSFNTIYGDFTKYPTIVISVIPLQETKMILDKEKKYPEPLDNILHPNKTSSLDGYGVMYYVDVDAENRQSLNGCNSISVINDDLSLFFADNRLSKFEKRKIVYNEQNKFMVLRDYYRRDEYNDVIKGISKCLTSSFSLYEQFDFYSPVYISVDIINGKGCKIHGSRPPIQIYKDTFNVCNKVIFAEDDIKDFINLFCDRIG